MIVSVILSGAHPTPRSFCGEWRRRIAFHRNRARQKDALLTQSSVMPNGDSPRSASRRFTPAQWVLLGLLGVSLFLAVVTGVFIALRIARPLGGRSVEEQLASTSAPVLAGTLDETFHRTGRGGEFRDLVLQPDGKILLSGLFDEVGGARHKSIARFNDDGTVDAGFDAQAGGAVHAVAVQVDGKIVLAGDFGSVNRISAKTVARVMPDGQIDDTFSPGRGGDKEARSVTVQPDGKILVGGNFVRFNGESHQRIVRLNEDGSVDSSFRASLNQAAWRIAVQPDGQILVRGHFTQVNGAQRFGLARLKSDGSLDDSFAPEQRFENSTTMAVQPDGKVLATTRRGPIVRLNVDGAVDDTFQSNATVDGSIAGLAVDNRGRVIVGGNFSTFEDFATHNLARLNSNGSLDKSFHCTHDFNDNVSRVGITVDDDVIAAGNFAERLLRFNGGGERRTTK